MPSQVVQRAARFLYANARLVDRAVFAVRFSRAEPDRLVRAVVAYRNADGGFGHALEADLRTPASQPLHTEVALWLLCEGGTRQPELAAQACEYLARVANDACELPAFVDGALDYPAASHWQDGYGSQPNIDRVYSVAAALHWHGAQHEWLTKATQACLEHLGDEPSDDAHILQAIGSFLIETGHTERLEELQAPISAARYYVEETPVTRYGLTPLRFAPSPESPIRRFFADELIEAHLDDLLARQSDDGGWPISFESPSEAAHLEWRGRWTVEALIMLEAYGRL